ncbi:Clustered mitochondria/Translation initiation factor eIF3 subunit 135, putative [Trypanosoma equiperdum]|uniref:Clustered mitochondria/Translation initiation factor eIF3 subunit 135, putative n=1 Tax=Trypanosoma equiperdum TaxID=5694 RepID=A0A1G4I7P7_TRYEQ|nr:Clustered mitochondria/Translation initiation factor eIF3 subunit 135, putative [Trypanosoma equiperdum]
MVRLPPIVQGSQADGIQRRQSVATAPAARSAARRGSIRFKKSLIYWKLFGASAPLYCGPLGEVVGEVEEGTVIRETRRYRDPFGNWWVASRSVDDSLLWLLFSSPPSSDGEVGQWRRVYDQQDQDIPSSPRTEEVAVLGSYSIPPEVSTKELPSLGDVHQFIRVLGKSWRAMTSNPAAHTRDWNTQYQQLVEQNLFAEREASTSARDQLRCFMEEFKAAAEEAALGVVAELVLPAELRSGRGVTGERNYFARNGLLVRVMLDDCDDEENKGSEQAWQVATQFFLAQQVLSLEAPKQLFHTLPTALVTFCGVRVCVFAIAPIELQNVVYLPIQELERGNLETPNFVQRRLGELGAAISLKGHVLKGAEGKSVDVAMSADVALIKGYDKRLYIIGSGRLLPELALLGNEENMKDPTKCNLWDDTLTTLRFRPEFLLRWSAPLNPDAFVESTATPEDNATIVEATEYIRAKLIPTVAAMVGLHEPIDIPRQDAVECTLCGNTLTNELRFVVCRSNEKCCHICSHCYARRLSEQGDSTRDIFCDAVKCGAGFRGPKGLLMQPSLSSIFHANGLNMRFLPFVYHAIPAGAKPVVGHYCEIEMVARAAVRVFRNKLRSTSQVIDEVRQISQDLFLGLLQSSGHVPERFWADEIGPTIEKMYGPLEPFNTEKMDVELLYHRVADLSGIVLSSSSVESLYGEERPFLQLESVEPVVKVVVPPYVADEEAQEELRRGLYDSLGETLLFWIGAFTDGVEGSTSGGKLPHEPFYLTEQPI